MDDLEAVLPALFADCDEFVSSALGPGCLHNTIVVPYGPEARPVTGIAPHDPVLNQITDRQFVFAFGIHGLLPRVAVLLSGTRTTVSQYFSNIIIAALECEP